MSAIHLTPREVAELAHVPRRAVEKAIEEKALHVRKGAAPTPYGRAERRFLGLESVAYVDLLRRMAGEVSLTLAAKRRLARALRAAPAPELHSARVDLAPALTLDVGLAGDAIARAERYARAREAWIDSDPAIKGGLPVIRGTRLTVHSLAARLTAGDRLEDLVADNPDLPPEAIEAAVIFARAHPLAGRPALRPAA